MRKWGICEGAECYPGLSDEYPGIRKALLDLSFMLCCRFEVMETESVSRRSKGEKVYRVEVDYDPFVGETRHLVISDFEKMDIFEEYVRELWENCSKVFARLTLRDIRFDGESLVISKGAKRMMTFTLPLDEALEILCRGAL